MSFRTLFAIYPWLILLGAGGLCFAGSPPESPFKVGTKWSYRIVYVQDDGFFFWPKTRLKDSTTREIEIKSISYTHDTIIYTAEWRDVTHEITLYQQSQTDTGWNRYESDDTAHSLNASYFHPSIHQEGFGRLFDQAPLDCPDKERAGVLFSGDSLVLEKCGTVSSYLSGVGLYRTEAGGHSNEHDLSLSITLARFNGMPVALESLGHLPTDIRRPLTVGANGSGKAERFDLLGRNMRARENRERFLQGISRPGFSR